MFRIKNVRNSTVAKQSNISNPNAGEINNKLVNRVAVNQRKVEIPQSNAGVKMRPPSKEINKRNENIKLKVPQNHRKIVFNTKTHNILNEIPLKSTCKNIECPPSKKLEKAPFVEKRVEIIADKRINEDTKTHSDSQIPIQEFTQQRKPITHQQKKQEKTYKCIPEEPEVKIEIKCQNYEQLAKQQEQEKRSVNQEEEMRHKREELARQKRQKQAAEERKNQLKLKQMMEKVNARRKARQESREHRIKLDKEMEMEKRQNQSVGGIIALTDALAHVEMSEAVMDAQINHILNMKFANYPNRQAIERQVQELERINRSYLLVRTDPTNPLNRGLSNFRIELFNRVGELIMAGQAQLGPSISGLQVIQSDSRNYPQIKGMRVTRGLEGHIDKLLKKIVLQQVEECAICLCQIEKGKTIYEVQCGHKFHEKCLQDWLNTNANCPACRYNIKFNHY